MSTRVRFSKPPRHPVAPRPRRRTGKQSWVVIFILVSLLAHLVLVLTIVLLNGLLPAPKLKDQPLAVSSTTLSLEQPPPAAPAAPPQHLFMPTQPDAGAPHVNTQIESDNDTRLKSQSHTARDNSSIMPDLQSKITHPANLRDAPNSPSTQPPHAAANAAQPHHPSQPSTTTQNAPQITPHPQQAAQVHPSQPNAKPQDTQPATAATPQTATQQYDPNGLPVLPALNAPTMAPASQQEQESTPASSLPAVAQDIHGAVGAHGDTSPAAMATELGRYKAKVYAAVGTRWYHRVDQQFQLLPVGMVHIQFTIYKDGRVETKVLDGDTPALQILLTISLDSIREAAPFDPFTPGMIQQVGDSYTDDFTFSIYGGN